MTIVGVRQTGKTLDLIKLAHENKGVILTYNSDHAKNIKTRAEKELGLLIREPISVDNFLDLKFREQLFKSGILNENDNIYIDESDIVIKKIFSSFNISFKGMTVGPPSNGGLVFKQLDDSEEKINLNS
jgi:hypothetical protein